MKKLTLIILAIFAAILPSEAKKYQGAEIRTNESFLYGRFEVKMKSADASGMLISFFTFYDDPSFATNWNEIDIEILGRYQNEVQFNAIVGKHQMNEKRQILNFNPHKDFHTYSFDWTPEYISWSVDGQEVYKQTGEHVAKMDKKQKIMMNIWPSEFWEWTGPWDPTKLPLYAMYDYVKYYEYKPKTEEKFQLSWEDNFDNIDNSRWSFATHSFEGNACTFDPSNAKVKDGYLILTLANSDYEITDDKLKEIKIEGGSVGKASIASASIVNGNTVKITFNGPVNRVNARKENFKLEGVEIIKTKFAMDMTNVELVTSTLDNEKEYNLQFTPPNQTGEIYTQKIKLVKH
jgi:beta-glucanase (GH16 family)